jgi:hypothetical protein
MLSVDGRSVAASATAVSLTRLAAKTPNLAENNAQ